MARGKGAAAGGPGRVAAPGKAASGLVPKAVQVVGRARSQAGAAGKPGCPASWRRRLGARWGARRGTARVEGAAAAADVADAAGAGSGVGRQGLMQAGHRVPLLLLLLLGRGDTLVLGGTTCWDRDCFTLQP